MDNQQNTASAPRLRIEEPGCGSTIPEIKCPLCHHELETQEPETVADLKWNIFSELYYQTKELNEGRISPEQYAWVEQLRRNLTSLIDMLHKI